MLSTMHIFSPERDSRSSATSQPAPSPGLNFDELLDGGTFAEPYMQLPHNMTVRPVIETPYDEITLYKNAN